jgi:hypothetical protein
VTGVFGVFLSFDLFQFFMFYELAVLPMYLLIGIWGTGPKEYAAMKLTLMLLMGSAFVLVGFLALYHVSGLHTFDLQQLARAKFSGAFQKWAFPMIFVGFGVIGALYPLHTWSPDGHSSAPTAVSMLHAGVLMKLGGYGALRIAVYLLPEGAVTWGLFFMVLATVSIVYGAFVAVMQKEPGSNRQVLALPQDVPHLLRHPATVWGDGRLGQQDRAALEVHDDEHECTAKAAERPNLLCEQVSTQQHVCLPRKELTPGQPFTLRRRRQTVAPQNIRDTALRDLDPQLLQLPTDALVTPGVLARQAAHQGFDLARRPRTARPPLPLL